MANEIHPTAFIDPTAILGDGIKVGPFSVVGAQVEIGDNSVLGPHVTLEDRTILGKNCQVSAGAVIGGAPQDLAYKGEPTRVRIGDNTLVRECATINRATGEGNETVVGDNCFLMSYSHLGHNCQVGNHVILANAVQIGGHVHLGDYVFIGGASAVHQNCRIGRMAFLSGNCGCRQDIPPYSMNDGWSSSVRGLNTIGLRRRGLSQEERTNLKRAFYKLFFSNMNQAQAIESIRETLTMDEYLQDLIDFVLASKRGISRKRSNAATETDLEQEAEKLTV